MILLISEEQTICSVCIYTAKHPLSRVLISLLMNTDYKYARTGLATYHPWLRNTGTVDFHILQFSPRCDWLKSSLYACTVPACLFLIIDDINFRGNTLCSGQGSSDFPRLECVSEHVEDVCVCVCMRMHACVSLSRGEVQSSRPCFWSSVLAVDGWEEKSLTDLHSRLSQTFKNTQAHIECSRSSAEECF